MQSSIPYNGYTDNRSTLLDTAKKQNYDASGVLSMYSSYSRDTGVIVVPLSDPEAESVVFVHLCNNYGTRTVEFEASKRGTPPIVPAPMDSYVAGDVLLGANITVFKPIPDDGSGGANWRVTGTYTYGQASTRTENSHYETGMSSVGDSYIFAQMGQNTKRSVNGSATFVAAQGVLGGAIGAMGNQAWNGEYSSTMFNYLGDPIDVNVPVVDFAQEAYCYYCPIFSNQFFSQPLIM